MTPSRYEILTETYAKTLHIEAQTMLSITKNQIIPAIIAYQNQLVQLLGGKAGIGLGLDSTLEANTIKTISTLSKDLYQNQTHLEDTLCQVQKINDTQKAAQFYADTIVPAMDRLRSTADQLETNMPSTLWPLPSYSSLLFF